MCGFLWNVLAQSWKVTTANLKPLCIPDMSHKGNDMVSNIKIKLTLIYGQGQYI